MPFTHGGLQLGLDGLLCHKVIRVLRGEATMAAVAIVVDTFNPISKAPAGVAIITLQHLVSVQAESAAPTYYIVTMTGNAIFAIDLPGFYKIMEALGIPR